MARKSRFRSKKGYNEALQERTDKASNTRGGKWKPIFLESVKFEKWASKEGEHMIDIIPYLDEDDEFQYKLELMVHSYIGPDEGNYICPKTFGSNADCPLCAARLIALAEDDEVTAKALKTKDRVVYNIVCYDSNKEEDKGVQIWEASSYLAEENFKATAKKRKKGGGGGNISFADPDEGRTISWEHTGVKAKTRYVGFQMDERDEPISDEILDEAYILEDLIDIPSVETLQEQADIVLGSMGSDEPEPEPEKEEKPSRTRRTRRTRDEKADEPGDAGTGEDAPMHDPPEEPEPEKEEKPSRTRRTRRRR